MSTRLALLTAIMLAIAAMAWADGELIYPWDNPSSAPGAIVPCVPCIFSLPGLGSLGVAETPGRGLETVAAAPTVAARDVVTEARRARN